MYDFKIEAADKPTMYKDLALALQGLIGDETDPVANMANAAGLIWESVPDLNWAGFYRNIGGELVLGPFQGRPACIRIPLDKGVFRQVEAITWENEDSLVITNEQGDLFRVQVSSLPGRWTEP